MYPDSRQPVAARPSTTERRRQGRKKARKAIRGLAMALRVTAKWYTCTALHYITLHCMFSLLVLPCCRTGGRSMTVWRAGRRWRGSTRGTAPAAAARWGPRWPAPGGHRSTVGSVMVQAVWNSFTVCLLHRNKNKILSNPCSHFCLIFLVNSECKHLSAGRVSVS